MLETVIKRDRDLGTPARESTQTVTLTIDGQEVTVPEGSSLMRAAAEAGINIPKLCATDSLEPFGSCRLCLVQIDGRRGYPASCTTPAEHGMVVHTETPKLRELRRGVMELHLRPPAGLPDLSGQRRLRAAGHGRRGRPARGALRLPGRQPPGQRQGRVQSVLHLRPVQVHRLQPLRACEKPRAPTP